MALPPLQGPLSSSGQSSNHSTPSRHRGPLRQLYSRWKLNRMQGTASKLILMTGFLINSTAMSGLFYLLKYEIDERRSSSAQLCVPFPKMYEYGLALAFPYFTFLSIFVFFLMCFIHCRRNTLNTSIYKIITILGITTFILSIFLVLISSTAIMMRVKNCKQTDLIQELTCRFVFQSTASFLTSAIYMIIGISLVSGRNQQSVNPMPPPTPIYQIRPPEFDSFFPPPPTYQQSQMHHQHRNT